MVNALLAATRAFAGVAASSLVVLDDKVTRAQFRTLIVLAGRGPRRAVEVADDLGVDPSTGTRMCDRLVRKGLIRRTRPPTDRRAVLLALTPAGRDLVAEVRRRHVAELTRLVRAIHPARYGQLVQSLSAVSAAAGEPASGDWWMA